ncbi:hypothetical protein ILYODFUR_027809, partial [Ilyodon furcidens]
MESRRVKLLGILRGSSSKLSWRRCNCFFPSISLFLTLSSAFDVRSKAAVILSPLLPLSLSLSLPGARENGSAKCHVFVLGMSLLCDLAGFLKIDQRKKK